MDPGASVRSKDYRALLVFAALIGVLVSFASWCFLELIYWIQRWVFVDLPGVFGFETPPTWWSLPFVGLAGVLVAIAVARLPGRGGHIPAEGLKTGPPTAPVELPGVLLAALASVGLGLVLGPEAPLIALATGLGIFAVRLVRKEASDQVMALMAAAAAFAAISSLFGSPVIGAIIIIEAAGLGGAMLPVVLLPGLLAAGIGSLVFIGMGSLTGLSSNAYAVAPLSLPSYAEPTFAAFAWTIALAVVVAFGAVLITLLGRRIVALVQPRPFVAIPLATLAIATLAIVFSEITGEPVNLVLFSGQDAMGGIVQQAAHLSLGTLGLVIVFKGIAYGLSLGSARGGPTFPAMFLGVVAGLMAGHLPGFAQTPAVAALMGAATVAILRLPLSSVLIAMVLSQAGLSSAPLIIVAVVVAYITAELLAARRGSGNGAPTSVGTARSHEQGST
jgi:H+/Cl- antiporter ClcA